MCFYIYASIIFLQLNSYWTEYWREHVYCFISQTSGREEKALHSLKWAIDMKFLKQFLCIILKKAYLLASFYVL